MPTTLCAGCGHNSITNHLIKALYEYGVEPHKLAKMSGIGCSSKTPAYFVEQAHGFNGLHGRMPSAATGAKVANRELLVLGISGDGDTASIGLGQYCHMIRRNVDLTYLIENNGCYGLTKGQFSATADVGSTQKSGKINEYATIDVCGLAIELGATSSPDRSPATANNSCRCCKARFPTAAPRFWTSSARASPSTTIRARPRATRT